MRKQKASRPKYADAISLPLEFELERSDRRARSVVTIVLGFIALSLLLLGLAPFNSVVVAPGSLAPRGEAVTAHHDRGGVVAEVLVARGALVTAGQPLMRLRSDELTSEINELAARRSATTLRIERLRALLSDREANFDSAKATQDAIEAERRLYEAERLAVIAELAALEAQTQTRLDAADAFAAEIVLLQRAAAALGERRDMLTDLVARGAAARRDLLELATQLSETEARIAGVRGAEIEARRQAEEFRRRAASVSAERRAAWSTALSEALRRARLVERTDCAATPNARLSHDLRPCRRRGVAHRRRRPRRGDRTRRPRRRDRAERPHPCRRDPGLSGPNRPCRCRR